MTELAHFHREGTGEPLVLIHGFTAHWTIWKPCLAALTPAFDVLAVGVAGHHGSPALPEGAVAGVRAFADAVERDMDEHGFETAHLCGNSLGGWIALELAARGRARSVVAISPGGGWERGSTEEARIKAYFKRLNAVSSKAAPHAERLMKSGFGRKLAFRDVFNHGERLSAHEGVLALKASVECPVFWDVLEGVDAEGPADIGPIDVPVTITWGTGDRILPYPAYAKRFRSMVPGARWEEWLGEAHCPMLDVPERVVRAITTTAARAGAGAAARAADDDPVAVAV